MKKRDGGLIREPFPGDQDKPIKNRWKPFVFVLLPFPIAGFCWLLGIREPFALVVLSLFCSLALGALLYYFFFSEPGFFSTAFREFFKPRR